MQVIAIIFSLIDILLLIYIIVIYLKRCFYHHRYSQTLWIIDNFGYLISVSGKVKVGKSSFSNGLKHAYEELMISKLMKKIKDVKIKFYKTNFTLLDAFVFEKIICHLECYGRVRFKELAEMVIYEFKLNDKFVYDYINVKSIFKLIVEYVEAFYYLNINFNFVQSKTKTYSKITGKFNLEHNIDSHKIFEAYVNGTWSINRYTIELMDEASDEVEASIWRQMEDTGVKEFRRKYAHIFEETNRLISIKQDSSDEVKRLRTLYHNNLNVMHKPVLRGVHTNVQRIIRW
ncbi:MAG: hypothetical protein ACOX02_04345 [Acholeplasmatales bacterium]